MIFAGVVFVQGYIIAWGNNQYHQLGLTGTAHSMDSKLRNRKGADQKPMKVSAMILLHTSSFAGPKKQCRNV